MSSGTPRWPQNLTSIFRLRPAPTLLRDQGEGGGTACSSYDRSSQQEWPETTREAVAKFRQGDIITEPGFFYVARPDCGIYSLTRQTGDPNLDMESTVTECLLNPSHPQGHSKASFFGRLGFDRQHPDLLGRALLHLAHGADMEESVFAYGTKFVGVGRLQGPTGREARVATVWILKDGAPPPILVTAYPAWRKRSPHG